MVQIDVEEALRQIRSRAALLAFTAECAEETSQIATREVYEGIGDVCDDIRDLVNAVKKTLDVHALGLSVGG